MKHRLLLLPLVSLLLGSFGTQAQVTFTKAPSTNQLYPRSLATNEGTVEIAGVVDDAGIENLVLRHFVDDVLVGEQDIAIGAGRTFAYSTDITAALEAHRFELSGTKGGSSTVVLDARDVVAGDVYIIQGQSNAVAKRYADSATGDESPWIRTYGSTDPQVVDDPEWYKGIADLYYTSGAVGQLGISFGKHIVETANAGIPVALLNGAENGMPISHFQKDAAPPSAGVPNNYQRLLQRAEQAGVRDAIRGILWYQGEAHGTRETNVLTGQQYLTAFQKLKAFWEGDYPGIEKIYVFQIRDGCGGPSVDLRDMMRRFGVLFSDVEVMSTTALSGHFQDSPGLYCHWEYANGYRDLGKRVFDLANRDLYGSTVTDGINPPNPLEAYFSRANRKEVTIVMESEETLVYQTGVHQDFFVYNPAAAEFTPIAAIDGSASGNRVVLKFAETVPSTYRVGYADKPRAATLQRWVTNMNGVGLFTFTAPIDTRDNLPPDPPELIDPINGENDLASPVTLDWADALLATGYDVEVATSADFTNKVLTASTSATEQLFTPEASGSFFWRVRAKNINGTSDWSPTWSFSVLFPPGIPTLTQPANGAIDRPSNLTLQWVPGVDATSHDVQVGPSSTFPVDPDFPSVTVTSLQIGPLSTGQYFWRVRARNPNGVSAWTATWDFRVLALPPAPVLVAPQDNATDLSAQLKLTWQTAEDASAYRLQVSSVSDFSSTLLDQLDIQATEWQLSGLETGGYYWRVRGSNVNGSGDWSTVRYFTVLSVPDQVELVSPADAAANLPDSVRFSWRPVPDAQRYQLQVATSGNFLTSYYDNNQLTDTTQVVQFSSGTYFWHVRAVNVNGLSPWSQTFRFSVLARPIAPALVYPEDGAWNLPATFSLRWNALSDAITYDAEVATAEDFEDLLLSREGVTEAQTAIGPLVPGDYFWRVRARNNSGIGDWSSPFGFSIVTAPGAVTLLTPENGEVGTVSEPTLNWEPATLAGSYQLQVSRNESFTSIAFMALDLSATQMQVGPLEPATTYYWRVQARNAVGASPWSQTFRFTVRQNTALERDETERPDRFALHPAYPNPFNPSTLVSFSLPDRSPVRLTVHDLHGRLVDVLVSQPMEAGTYRTLWHAAGESSGVYLVRIEAGSFMATQKLILLK